MSVFTFMHKDVPVFDCVFYDGHFDRITKLHNKEHVPLNCFDFRNEVSGKNFDFWWSRRVIPRERYNKRLIDLLTDYVPSSALGLNSLGLNLSDCYWLKPFGSNLKWSDVNFYENSFNEHFGEITLGSIHGLRTNAINLIGPDSCSGGNVPKGWRIVNGKRMLVKAPSVNFNQEPYNEVIGSKLCSALNISHVDYSLFKHKGVIYSACECMVNGNEDIVSAYDVVSHIRPVSNDVLKDIEAYKQFAEEHGVEDIRREFDSMIMIDYLLRNTDRHWSNFGLIRNADTLKFERAVPLFDFGNSLFHDCDVDTSAGLSALTRMNLFDDLRLVENASCINIKTVKAYSNIVKTVVKQSGLPRSKRLQLIDFAGERSSILMKYFDASAESERMLDFEYN